MVADIVDVDGLLRAVLQTRGDGADIGLALGARAERRRLGQQRLQELQRNDLAALEHHRIDAQHAHIAQHVEVLQVGVAEGHPEPDALDFRVEFGQRLQLLMVHEVHVLLAHLVEVEHLLFGQRRPLDPLAVLPVPRGRGHFAQIDLRVEIGGEGVAVVAAVAVEDVQGLDRVEQVLGGVGGEDRGHAGVEAAAQQRHQAGLLEAVLIGPLPAIFELGLVLRLVIGGVEIVHARRQTGLHDRQVLIGQGQVDHERRLHLLNQRRGRGDVVGVQGGGLHHHAGAGLHRFRNGVALGLGAAGQRNVAEDVRRHGHLVDRHRSDAAGADHQNSTHLRPSLP